MRCRSMNGLTWDGAAGHRNSAAEIISHAQHSDTTEDDGLPSGADWQPKNLFCHNKLAVRQYHIFCAKV